MGVLYMIMVLMAGTAILPEILPDAESDDHQDLPSNETAPEDQGEGDLLDAAGGDGNDDPPPHDNGAHADDTQSDDGAASQTDGIVSNIIDPDQPPPPEPLPGYSGGDATIAYPGKAGPFLLKGFDVARDTLTIDLGENGSIGTGAMTMLSDDGEGLLVVMNGDVIAIIPGAKDFDVKIAYSMHKSYKMLA